jgi:hypothetical protein
MSYQTFVTHFTDATGNRRYGARAVEPPADTGHAVRGNLYAIVELLQAADAPPAWDAASLENLVAPTGADTARIAEQLLAAIQTTYYTARGAQSSVLSDAVRRVNELLRAINAQRQDPPLYAGVSCAALLNGMVTVASSGPALSLIVTGSVFEQFPSEAAAPQDLLGLVQEPQVKTYRRQMQETGVFFLGGSRWLQQIPVRKLLGSVAHAERANAADVVGYLSQQSGYAAVPGLLVVLESDSDDSGRTASSGASNPSTQTPPPRPRRSSFGLPTAVHAEPPVHGLPTSSRAQIPHTAANPAGMTEGASTSAPAAWSAAVTASPRGASHTSHPEWEAAVQTRGSETKSAERQLAEMWDGARGRLLGAWGALAAMLPDRTRRVTSADTQHASTSADAQDQFAYALGASSAEAAPGGAYAQPTESETTAVEADDGGVQSALTDSWQKAQSFTPPAPARGKRARFFVLLAVAILVLVPIIVATVVWQRGASLRAEGDMLVSAAQANLDSANAALDLGDKTTARVELTKAQENLAEATLLIGNTPAINTLLQEIERQLQDVLQITPLYGLVEPLARFPLEASPHRLLIVDQDIYVLDLGRHLVQRFHLDADRQMITEPEGEVVLRRGDVINGVTVGSLLAMTWQDPIPGIEDKSSLLVLDGNNNVFRYNQRVEGATTLTFGEQDAWQTPTQLHNYLGRIYVADSGRGQIYRYDPGQYEAAPQPWLVAPTAQGLAGLQSMAIEGDIWLLFGNGLLLRYNQGQQAPFALENDVGMVSEPVDIFVGDQDNSSIYLADAGQERILIFGKDGSYQRQLQAVEGHPLRDLRSLYVDEVAGTIYILTKSSLFQHPLPQ